MLMPTYKGPAQKLSAVKIPDLSGSTEYPSDKEIVAAVAGELMRTAVRVSMSAVADIFVRHHPHVSELECHIFVDGWKHTNRCVDLPQECRANIYLDRDGAVEALTDLIKRVEALGEVSA